MKIENFGMIIAPGYRTKAYLQKLVKLNLIPAYVILKINVGQGLKEESKTYDQESPFNPDESELFTLEKNRIDYEIIESDTFNSDIIIKTLKKRQEKYFIYSGSDILKKEILNIGKTIIHIHPGRLPDFRGSTCFHYQNLAEGKCGASSFIMKEGLDLGDIILVKEFKRPINIDIFKIYDPDIRSEVLVDTIKILVKEGKLQGKPQSKEQGRDYYIIHPLLEHLSILKSQLK